MNVHPRAYSAVASDEYVLTDGILIFRQEWRDVRNNPKPLNL